MRIGDFEWSRRRLGTSLKKRGTKRNQRFTGEGLNQTRDGIKKASSPMATWPIPGSVFVMRLSRVNEVATNVKVMMA